MSLEITRQGSGYDISLPMGGSMRLEADTLVVHHKLHKSVTYELKDSRCAGLTCTIEVRGGARDAREVAVWQLRIWSDSRNSTVLSNGEGPAITRQGLGDFLNTTDDELAASPLGKVARLIDDAIVGAPRATPLPHVSIGTYMSGQVVWIPSLGLSVLDRGSRAPTASMGS